MGLRSWRVVKVLVIQLAVVVHVAWVSLMHLRTCVVSRWVFRIALVWIEPSLALTIRIRLLTPRLSRSERVSCPWTLFLRFRPALLHHFLSILSTLLDLLLHHYFLHLLDGYRTFYINPFLFNYMLVSETKNKIHRSNIFESYEPKASWFQSSFVLQDDAVFDVAKVLKVVLECYKLEIMWKSTDKHFSELSIYLITALEGLLTKRCKSLHFFALLQFLEIRLCLSVWHVLNLDWVDKNLTLNFILLSKFVSSLSFSHGLNLLLDTLLLASFFRLI